MVGDGSWTAVAGNVDTAGVAMVGITADVIPAWVSALHPETNKPSSVKTALKDLRDTAGF